MRTLNFIRARRLDDRVEHIIAITQPGDFQPGQRLAMFVTSVSKSATIWQGCDRSVRPLITGTLE
jgi:hypothetical protein